VGRGVAVRRALDTRGIRISVGIEQDFIFAQHSEVALHRVETPGFHQGEKCEDAQCSA
jgi:hypothetical protein